MVELLLQNLPCMREDPEEYYSFVTLEAYYALRD